MSRISIILLVKAVRTGAEPFDILNVLKEGQLILLLDFFLLCTVIGFSPSSTSY